VLHRWRSSLLDPVRPNRLESVGQNNLSQNPGDSLLLIREPDNSFDPLAIKMMDEAGHHLGYVPRVKNEALARLMDAGKLLFGKIESKQWKGDWLQMEAHIYMRDY
jgi:hypothetical protein